MVGKVGYGVMPKAEDQGVGHLRRRHRRGGSQQEQESGLSLLRVGGVEADGRALAAGRRRRSFRNSVIDDPETRAGVKMPKEWLDCVMGSAKVSKLGLPVIVPVAEFRDVIGAASRHAVGRGPGDRDEEGDGAVQADPGEK